MLEKLVVKHAAPTLACLKAANIFGFRGQDEEIESELERLNAELNEKDVYVTTLCRCSGRALICVYRCHALKKILSDPSAGRLLKDLGYPETALDYSCQGERMADIPDNCLCREIVESYLTHLADRVSSSKEFPHEIGIFLGYPMEDVLGFIREGGKNYKLSGMWKVYGDRDKACRLFTMFEHCARVYEKVFQSGRSLRDLTVAS